SIAPGFEQPWCQAKVSTNASEPRLRAAGRKEASASPATPADAAIADLRLLPNDSLKACPDCPWSLTLVCPSDMPACARSCCNCGNAFSTVWRTAAWG